MLTSSSLPRKFGSELIPLLVGLRGSERGFNTEGDVITQTVDGVPLNNIWAEFRQAVDLVNRQRQGIVDFLTYTVANPVVTVPQFGGGSDFEVASEFGVPRAVRQEASYFQMGFDFEWYDSAVRYTWKFLAEATAEQITSLNAAILEADNRLVFNEVMKTLFSPANRVATITNNPYTVYSLYNADGTVPPQYKTTTFTGTHSHYITSGAAVVDPKDLEDLMLLVTEHGFSPDNGVDLVIMVNKTEGDRIRQFRSLSNGSAAGSTYVGQYDFIPAQGTPALLRPTDVQQVGGSPAATLRGLKVIGSYGDAVIVQEDYIPSGYMVCFGTGGAESLTNPIGIREHANPGLRGLRLVKGRRDDYPLQDSYYQRGFGTGIRQRGGAAIMQITASASYTAPAVYARP